MARTLTTICSQGDILAYIGGVDTDAELGRLTMIWRGVEARIRRHCQQNIAQPADPYIDYLPNNDRGVHLPGLLQSETGYPGAWGVSTYVGPLNDGHVLVANQGLIRSITSVYLDLNSQGGTNASDFPSTTLLAATEYQSDDDWVDPAGVKMNLKGWVIRNGGVWSLRRRTIKVTYVAGLTEAELDDEYSDIRMAVYQEVATAFRNTQTDDINPIKSEKLGDWSVTYAIPETDEMDLSPRLRSALRPFVRYVL